MSVTYRPVNESRALWQPFAFTFWPRPFPQFARKRVCHDGAA